MVNPPHKSRDLTMQEFPALSGREHRLGFLAGAVLRQTLTRNGAEQ
jgi:adenylosuccinate synthase